MEDRCVTCGVIVPEGRQVCPNCEARQAPVAPRLGHAGEGLWICGNCNIAVFPYGVNYCHYCGRKVEWK